MRKFITVLLLLSFGTTSLGITPALANPDAADSVDRKPLPENLTELEIPSSLAAVEEIYHGNSGRMVILIQDAHAVGEAQKSIQETILHLTAHYEVPLVTLEGAYDELDATLLRSFPDPKILAGVIDGYLEKGELSGAATSSIFGPPSVKFYGMDDRVLYEKEIDAFLESSNQAPGFLVRWKQLESRHRTLQKEIYSPERIELESALEDFEINQKDLISVIHRLENLSTGISPEEFKTRFPHVAFVAEEIRNQQRDINAGVLKEIDELTRKIQESVSGVQAVAEFQSHLQAYQTEQITPAAFASYLAGQKIPGVIKSLSPALTKLANSHEQLISLKGSLFFEEWNDWTRLLRESLCRNEEERTLTRAGERLDQMKKFLNLEMNHGDWKSLSKQKSADRTGSKQKPAGILESDITLFSQELLSKKFSGFEFYRIAEDREKYFEKRISRLMTRRGSRSAIAMAGGFHTEGLKQIFKARGISYISLTPKIKTLGDEKAYRGFMRGEVSWKKYFEPQSGRINLYEAFHYAAIDRLSDELEDSAENRTHSPAARNRMLQSWRDQLIRRLVAENRVKEAGSYTRFLDKAISNDAGISDLETLKQEWIVKAGRFIDGFGRLNPKNGISPEAILKLASANTSIAWPAVGSFQRNFTVPAAWRSPRATPRGSAQIRSEVRSPELGRSLLMLAANLTEHAENKNKRKELGLRENQLTGNAAGAAVQAAVPFILAVFTAAHFNQWRASIIAGIAGAVSAAAVFIWKSVKEVRPVGTQIAAINEREFGLYREFSGALENFMRAAGEAGSPVPEGESDVSYVLKKSMEIVEPEIPYLVSNEGRVIRKISEFEDQINHLVIPYFSPFSTREIEASADRYFEERNRLLQVLGEFFASGGEGRTPQNVSFQMGRVSDRIDEFENILNPYRMWDSRSEVRSEDKESGSYFANDEERTMHYAAEDQDEIIDYLIRMREAFVSVEHITRALKFQRVNRIRRTAELLRDLSYQNILRRGLAEPHRVLLRRPLPAKSATTDQTAKIEAVLVPAPVKDLYPEIEAWVAGLKASDGRIKKLNAADQKIVRGFGSPEKLKYAQAVLYLMLKNDKRIQAELGKSAVGFLLDLDQALHVRDGLEPFIKKKSRRSEVRNVDFRTIDRILNKPGASSELIRATLERVRNGIIQPTQSELIKYLRFLLGPQADQLPSLAILMQAINVLYKADPQKKWLSSQFPDSQAAALLDLQTMEPVLQRIVSDQVDERLAALQELISNAKTMEGTGVDQELWDKIEKVLLEQEKYHIAISPPSYYTRYDESQPKRVTVNRPIVLPIVFLLWLTFGKPKAHWLHDGLVEELIVQTAQRENVKNPETLDRSYSDYSESPLNKSLGQFPQFEYFVSRPRPRLPAEVPQANKLFNQDYAKDAEARGIPFIALHHQVLRASLAEGGRLERLAGMYTTDPVRVEAFDKKPAFAEQSTRTMVKLAWIWRKLFERALRDYLMTWTDSVSLSDEVESFIVNAAEYLYPLTEWPEPTEEELVRGAFMIQRSDEEISEERLEFIANLWRVSQWLRSADPEDARPPRVETMDPAEVADAFENLALEFTNEPDDLSEESGGFSDPVYGYIFAHALRQIETSSRSEVRVLDESTLQQLTDRFANPAIDAVSDADWQTAGELTVNQIARILSRLMSAIDDKTIGKLLGQETLQARQQRLLDILREKNLKSAVAPKPEKPAAPRIITDLGSAPRSEVRDLEARISFYQSLPIYKMPRTQIRESQNIAEAGDILAVEILKEIQIKQKELPADRNVVVHFATGNTPWIGYTRMAEILNTWNEPATQWFLQMNGLDETFKPDMTRVIAFPLDAVFPQKRTDYHAFANILNNMFDKLGIKKEKRYFFYGDIANDLGDPMSDADYAALMASIEEVRKGRETEEVTSARGLFGELPKTMEKTNGLLINEFLAGKLDKMIYPEQFRYLTHMVAYSKRMADKIAELGGAHIFISGVGPSYEGKGHIGFMESMTPFDQEVLLGLIGYHMAADHMKEDGGMARLRTAEGKEKFGFVTFGFKELLYRPDVKVITIATGIQKAEAVWRGAEGDYDETYPISRLQKERGVLILDKTSASKLRYNTHPWDFELIGEWSEELIAQLFIRLSEQTGKKILDLVPDDYIEGSFGDIDQIRRIRQANIRSLLGGITSISKWNVLKNRVAQQIVSNLVTPDEVPGRFKLQPGSRITNVNPHLDDEFLAMRDVIKEFTKAKLRYSVYYAAKGYTAVHSAYALKALARVAEFNVSEIQTLHRESAPENFAEAEERYLRQLINILENGEDLHQDPNDYDAWSHMSSKKDGEQELRAKLLYLRLNQRFKEKLDQPDKIQALLKSLQLINENKPGWGSRDIELMADIKVFLRFNEAQTALMSLGVDYADVHYPFDATWYGAIRSGTARDKDIQDVENAFKSEQAVMAVSNGENFADFQAHSTTQAQVLAALDHLNETEGFNPILFYYRGVWDRALTTGLLTQLSVKLTRKQLEDMDRLFRRHYPSQSPPPVPDSGLRGSQHFSREVINNAIATKQEVARLTGIDDPEVYGILNFNIIPDLTTPEAKAHMKGFVDELAVVKPAVTRASGEAVNGPVPYADLSENRGVQVRLALAAAGLNPADVLTAAEIYKTHFEQTVSPRSEVRSEVPAAIERNYEPHRVNRVEIDNRQKYITLEVIDSENRHRGILPVTERGMQYVLQQAGGLPVPADEAEGAQLLNDHFTIYVHRATFSEAPEKDEHGNPVYYQDHHQIIFYSKQGQIIMIPIDMASQVKIESFKPVAPFVTFEAEKEFYRYRNRSSRIDGWQDAQIESVMRPAYTALMKVSFVYSAAWAHSGAPSDHDHGWGRSLSPAVQDYLAKLRQKTGQSLPDQEQETGTGEPQWFGGLAAGSNSHIWHYTGRDHAGYAALRIDLANPRAADFMRELQALENVDFVDLVTSDNTLNVLRVSVPDKIIQSHDRDRYENWIQNKWQEVETAARRYARSEVRTTVSSPEVTLSPLQRLATLNHGPLRIGFISTRAGYQDGTSREMEKWARVLIETGHSVSALIAEGEISQPGVETALLPEVAKTNSAINQVILSSILPHLASGSQPGLASTQASGLAAGAVQKLIEESAENVKEHIKRWAANLDVIILEDTNTVPDNVILGVAISKVIEDPEHSFAVISHDHRAGYFQASDFQKMQPNIASYLKRNFQLLNEQVIHVVTSENKEQEWLQELKHSKQGSVPTSVIHNVEDFGSEPAGDGYADDFFDQVPRISSEDTLIVHPERIIERKGLEYSLQLIKNIKNPKVKLVVMDDRFTDQGYRNSIDDYIRELGIQDRVVFLKDQFGLKRGVTQEGRKIYTMDDIFANATMVSFPSYEESLGAALIKALHAKLPVILYPYPSYHNDIKRREIEVLKYPVYSGPRMTSVSIRAGFAADSYQEDMRKTAKKVEAWLENPELRNAVAQKNYDRGKRYFSFDTLNRRLRSTIEKAIRLRMSFVDPLVDQYDGYSEGQRLDKLGELNHHIETPALDSDPKTTIALRVIRREKYASVVREALHNLIPDLRNELPEVVSLLRKIAKELGQEDELRKKDFAIIPVLREVDKNDAWPQIAANNDIVEHLQRVLQAQLEYQKRYQDGQTYVQRRPDLESLRHANVIYFSAESAFKVLRNYSGGLGVLSGDHVKGASDLGLNLIGFGLFYHKGYFTQTISRQGTQKNIGEEPMINMEDLPLQEAGPEGQQVFLNVPLPGRTVRAKVWKVVYGRSTVYLLDANIEGNSDKDKQLTIHLYRDKGGTRERLEQYMLLGTGGQLALKELKKLGMVQDLPETLHLNDGHPLFAVVQQVSALMAEVPDELVQSNKLDTEAMRFEIALQKAIAKGVFTTHTPVTAGNEVYDMNLMRDFLNTLFSNNHYAVERLLSMGYMNGGFNITVFLLQMSRYHNAVSQLHSEVARRMWKELYPGADEDQVPILDIVNSVHDEYWQTVEIRDLFREIYENPKIQALMQQDREKLRDKLRDDEWVDENIKPSGMSREDFDESLWDAHQTLKQKLYDEVIRREQIRQQRGDAVQEDIDYLNEIKKEAPDALTIGFARRFIEYKRGDLIFEDEERLTAIIKNAAGQAKGKPIHLFFAGKAHPEDEVGKGIIAKISATARRLREKGLPVKVFFVENYDIELARYLEAGVDIWLNNPIRPREASGTSGMKAAMNGVLNFSAKDGWVVEGIFWRIANAIIQFINGFLFGVESDIRDDFADSELLYQGLEKIVDLYHNRRPEWIRMMKASIISSTHEFGMERMLAKYAHEMYAPAVKSDGMSFEEARRQVDTQLAKRDEILRDASDDRKPKIIFDEYEANQVLGRAMPFSIAVDFGDADHNLFGVDGFLELEDSGTGDEKKPRRWARLENIEHIEANRYRYFFTVMSQEVGKHIFTVRVAPKNQTTWKFTNEGDERERVTIWNGAPGPVYVHDHEVISFRALHETDRGMLFFIRIPKEVKAEKVYWASAANGWLSGGDSESRQPFALERVPGTEDLWAIVVPENDAHPGEGYEFEFVVGLPGGRERRTTGHYTVNKNTRHARVTIHENNPLFSQRRADEIYKRISPGTSDGVRPAIISQQSSRLPGNDQALLAPSFISDVDAAGLLTIDQEDKGFQLQVGLGQTAEASRPGFLGFIWGYENLKRRNNNDLEAALRHHTSNGSKPIGDIIHYLLNTVLNSSRRSLLHIQAQIQDLADQMATASPEEKIALTRQALEIASRLAGELSWKVLVDYGRGNPDLLALFQDEIQGEPLRGNLVNFLEQYAVWPESTEDWNQRTVVKIQTTDNFELVPSYSLPLKIFQKNAAPGEKVLVTINRGKQRIVGEPGRESPHAVIHVSRLNGTTVLLGSMMEETGKLVQIYSVPKENREGSQNARVGRREIKILQEKPFDLNISGPEDLEIFRFDLADPQLMVEYLDAAIKGLTPWNEPPEVLIRREIEKRLENGRAGNKVRSFLQKMIEPGFEVMRDKFGRENLPVIMGFVAMLAPELLEQMKQWDEDVYQKLAAVLYNSRNRELFQNGNVIFHDTASTRTLEISKALNGRQIFIPIHFARNKPEELDPDGKIDVTATDVSTLGFDLNDGQLRQVRNLVTGRLYGFVHSKETLTAEGRDASGRTSSGWHQRVPGDWRFQVLEWEPAERKVGKHIYTNLMVSVNLGDLSIEIRTESGKTQTIMANGIDHLREILHFLASKGVGKIYLYGGLYNMSEYSQKSHTVYDRNRQRPLIIENGRIVGRSLNYRTKLQKFKLPDGREFLHKDDKGNAFSYVLDEDGLPELNPSIFRKDVNHVPSKAEREAELKRIVDDIHALGMEVIVDFIPSVSPNAINEKNYKWTFYKELEGTAAQEWADLISNQASESEKEAFMYSLLTQDVNSGFVAIRITENGQERVILVRNFYGGMNGDQIILNPFHPEVRDFHFRSLKRLIDAGVDGVRIDLPNELLSHSPKEDHDIAVLFRPNPAFNFQIPEEAKFREGDEFWVDIIHRVREYARSKYGDKNPEKEFQYYFEAYGPWARQRLKEVVVEGFLKGKELDENGRQEQIKRANGAAAFYFQEVFKKHFSLEKRNEHDVQIVDRELKAAFDAMKNGSMRLVAMGSNFDQMRMKVIGGSRHAMIAKLLALADTGTDVMIDLSDLEDVDPLFTISGGAVNAEGVPLTDGNEHAEHAHNTETDPAKILARSTWESSGEGVPGHKALILQSSGFQLMDIFNAAVREKGQDAVYFNTPGNINTNTSHNEQVSAMVIQEPGNQAFVVVATAHRIDNMDYQDQWIEFPKGADPKIHKVYEYYRDDTDAQIKWRVIQPEGNRIPLRFGPGPDRGSVRILRLDAQQRRSEVRSDVPGEIQPIWNEDPFLIEQIIDRHMEELGLQITQALQLRRKGQVPSEQGIAEMIDRFQHLEGLLLQLKQMGSAADQKVGRYEYMLNFMANRLEQLRNTSVEDASALNAEFYTLEVDLQEKTAVLYGEITTELREAGARGQSGISFEIVEDWSERFYSLQTNFLFLKSRQNPDLKDQEQALEAITFLLTELESSLEDARDKSRGFKRSEVRLAVENFLVHWAENGAVIEADTVALARIASRDYQALSETLADLKPRLADFAAIYATQQIAKNPLHEFDFDVYDKLMEQSLSSSLDAIEDHIEKFLSNQTEQGFHFNTVVPYSANPVIQKWWIGFLGRLQALADKQQNRGRLSANVLFLASSKDRAAGEIFFRKVEATQLATVVEINSKTAATVNLFLAMNPNALVFDMPETLAKQIARKKSDDEANPIVRLEGLIWEQAFPVSILLGLNAAKTSEITAELLKQIPGLFPQGMISFQGARLIIHQVARELMQRAEFARYIARMA